MGTLYLWVEDKLENYYISRNGLTNYQRNDRPCVGDNVRVYASAPGLGMVDATVCDIYLVNESGQVVGRPILTACVDAYSGICMGHSLGWEGGVYSIRDMTLNIIEDNDDMFGHTFRRNSEGDYRCTRAQVKAMLRDQPENTMDMEILEDIPMEYLNMETVHGYRNRHKSLKPGHPFERYADDEYLRSIGAAAVSGKDGKYHPTGAGLLMFGDEYNIVRQYPEYFLDYREMLDPTIRWTDRLQSSSGEWSGNVCDFYFRVYNKVIKEVKVPFKTVGGTRIDDTPVHKALREALANCLMNADFYEPRGVVIKLEDHKLTLENPGYIRVGKKQIRLGGVSDPRNKGLMKMFNLIDIGERAGSGVPDIFNVWNDEGFESPEIIEEFDPNRTKLVLSFEKRKKQAIKTSDKKQAIKTSDKKQATKTLENIERIIEYLRNVGEANTASISEKIGLSPARTRDILANMDEVEALGSNRNRTYRLKEDT